MLDLAIPGVTRARGARFRRWVKPMLPKPGNESPALWTMPDPQAWPNIHSPTLADAILSHEHGPPV